MSTQPNQTNSQPTTSQPAESTHLVLLLDRSGSMASVRQDVIGGWNEYLRIQQSLPGKATLTQIQFDTQNAFEVIHHFKALAEVPPLNEQTYSPRGGTPLLDALGKAITSTALDIASASPDTRPDKVLFVCMTDGQENSSSQFNKAEVTQLIERMQGGGWQFVFLSSDLKAVNDAAQLGFKKDSTIQFADSGVGVIKSMNLMAEKTLAYRQGGINRKISFSIKDRKKLMEEE